jgi:hypothetical protein
MVLDGARLSGGGGDGDIIVRGSHGKRMAQKRNLAGTKSMEVN